MCALMKSLTTRMHKSMECEELQAFSHKKSRRTYKIVLEFARKLERLNVDLLVSE